MSLEELKARVYGVIKDKVFISNISGQMVIEYKTDPAPAPAKFNAPDDELPF